MVEFFLILFPIFAAVIMPILLRAKKLWKAFFIILFTYFIASFIVVVINTTWIMISDGQSDPALVSGQIAEQLVSSLLTSIIFTPLALLLFVCWGKFRGKAEKGSE